MKRIRLAGWEAPTEIQSQTIRPLKNGQDLIASARTGSGKTGAFIIPMFAHLARGKKALVLVPTRELGAQVVEVYKQLAPDTLVDSVALIIGGTDMSEQGKALRQDPKLIVATPGRMIDWIQRKKLKPQTFEFVVVDEADRMLDFGFLPQLQEILSKLPESRQLCMFSATLPLPVMKIANRFLKNAVWVKTALEEASPVQIRQQVIEIPHFQKGKKLVEEVKNREGTILVFVRTQVRTEVLASDLREAGVRALAFHGAQSQQQRDQTLAQFRASKIQVLVATDVMSRGIDIDHVNHVINYDIPRSSEDYVHRIGRTGRAGREGNALTLISPEEKNHWNNLAQTLGNVPVVEKGGGKLGRHKHEREPSAEVLAPVNVMDLLKMATQVPKDPKPFRPKKDRKGSRGSQVKGVSAGEMKHGAAKKPQKWGSKWIPDPKKGIVKPSRSR